ncbi:hypothetical protein HY639_00830 [Candidatus Woesearchaeota archaeon]|nr:hypothetical protein [Candidatus Woesearchaeota archaeon]
MTIEKLLEPTCGYCGGPVQGTPVACSCGMLHCATCAVSNQTCTRYGCSQTLPIDKRALEPSAMSIAAVVAKETMGDVVHVGGEFFRGAIAYLYETNLHLFLENKKTSVPDTWARNAGVATVFVTEAGITTSLMYGLLFPYLSHSHNGVACGASWIGVALSAALAYFSLKMIANSAGYIGYRTKQYFSDKIEAARQQLTPRIDEPRPEELLPVDVLLDELSNGQSLDEVKAIGDKYKKKK